MIAENEYQEKMPEKFIQSSIGPGMRLQEARVKLGLSVDDIAQRLCLRTQVIEFLEADHYGDFAGLVFTRGYLKAYARVVGLDPKDIIEIFNGLGVADREIAKPVWRSQHKPTHYVDYDLSKYKWLIAGFSGVAVAVLLWGVSHTFSHSSDKRTAKNNMSTAQVALASNESINKEPALPISKALSDMGHENQVKRHKKVVR